MTAESTYASLDLKEIGDVVQIKIDGTYYNFIVISQGSPSNLYHDSCEGTWLMMQDCYISMAYDDDSFVFSTSDLYNYLNTTFYNKISADVQGLIQNAALPVPVNTPLVTGEELTNDDKTLVGCKVFVLSSSELESTLSVFSQLFGVVSWQTKEDLSSIVISRGGAINANEWNNLYATKAGSQVGYFSARYIDSITDDSTSAEITAAKKARRVANSSDGTAVQWWLRDSPDLHEDNKGIVKIVDTDGTITSTSVTDVCYVRPVIVLSDRALVDDDGIVY